MSSLSSNPTPNDIAYMLYYGMNVSSVIQKTRQRAGLTQADLAQRVRTTQSAISRLENGRVRPSLETIERLAKACGATLELRLRTSEAPTAEFESNLSLTPAGRLDQLIRAVQFVVEGRRAMVRRGG